MNNSTSTNKSKTFVSEAMRRVSVGVLKPVTRILEKWIGKRRSTGGRRMSKTGESFKLTPYQAAAQQFLTELRTRIATQPLPYQYGVEARALTSMWEVFEQARDAIKKNRKAQPQE
jgi:hypothetical protein